MHARQDRNETIVQEVRQGEYEFINPLLECNTELTNKKLLPDLDNKLYGLIEDKKKNEKATHISVYFRDLINGPWIGINEKEKFSPASMLKIPIMMAYYKSAEENPDLLSEKLLYKTAYNRGNNYQYFPSNEFLDVGMEYSIQDLIEKMIVYSDNDAKDLLIDFQIPVTDKQVSKNIGINLPENKYTENFLSIKELATYFRVLYNATYLNRYYSNKSLDLLSRADFDKGITSIIPDDIPVSHKFGERGELNGDKQLHECALVYYPKKQYLLCIMTRGHDYEQLINILKDISSLVFSYVK